MKLRDIRPITLIITTLASFLTPFMGSGVNIALPEIGRNFSLNVVLLSWISTIYLLSGAIFLVPIGKLADIYGRKRIFSFGVIIFTLMSLGSGLAPNIWILIMVRALQGIGSAMMFGTAMAIITSVYPPGQRGKALGINIASVYIGLSMGPFIGGIITRYIGWRFVFLSIIPLGITILYLLTHYLHEEWREARNQQFDITGSIIYSLSLLAIMLGFTLLPSWTGGLIIIPGILGFILFYRIETGTKYPILDLSLFLTNRVFAFSNLAALINYGATFGVTFLMSLYLQYIKGLSPQMAGLILIAQPGMQALVSPLAGKISDQFEPRHVASTGMALTALGLSFLIFIDIDTSIQYILMSLSILGTGYGFFSSPNTNAIMSSVDRRTFGVASGMVSTMRMIGQTFSMGVTMIIMSIFMGQASITLSTYPAFIQVVQLSTTIFMLLCLAGVFISSVRGNLHTHRNDT